MKDLFGHTLEPFDEVFYVRLTRSGVYFEKAHVIRLTDKRVEIKRVDAKAWERETILTTGTRIIKLPHDHQV